MDPWLPITNCASAQPSIPLLPPPISQQCSLDSKQYLLSIEAKLKRLKGHTNKEPTAKDIIKGLDQIRQVQLHSLTEMNAARSYVTFPPIENNVDNQPSAFVDVLRRTVAPEKQALCEEELLKLVDNDELLLMTLAALDVEKLQSQTIMEGPTGATEMHAHSETDVTNT